MCRRELLSLIPGAALAQYGTRNRYFARYPFDQWIESGERSQIRWITHVGGVQLSSHQRLAARVEIEIDAREAEKRRGRGEFVTFLQIEDSEGHKWRRHDTFSLAAIPNGRKAKTVFYVQEFFVLPGEYKIAMAVCDSETLEYSFTQRTLRVAPLKNDPLPNASVNLPGVEFISRFGLPDSWYQPYARGRLNLPVESAAPVQIDVIMNLSLSERAAGSLYAFRRNMSVLVPALKVLSQVRPVAGVLNIALLDLTKRRVWEEKDVRELSWDQIRAPFAEANPGVIDAQSLAAKEQMTQFFWDQVLTRLRDDGGGPERRVALILGSPTFLGHQIRVEPAVPPKSSRRKVFYFRYRPLPRNRPIPPQTINGGAMMPQASALPSDDLERTLRALDCRNFNVMTPADFRRALATVMEAIRAWVE